MVLIYLFKYLPHGDRVAASQTCRLWHEAATDAAFQSKQQICFTKKVHQEYITDTFNSDSYQKFTSFAFREIDLENKLTDFWKQNGPYIRHLDFDECELHEKMFIKILDSIDNLESLSVSNCRELFMSASLLDDKSINLCRDSLRNLKRLNLSNNRYLSDALFGRIVCTTETLEELNLSECPITFHIGLHKKFYPLGVNNINHTSGMPPSESILTFLFISKVLEDNSSTLKKLYFNGTLIDGSALKLISQLPNLSLRSFHAFQCDQLNSDGINRLAECQTNLTELNLGLCSRVTDEVLTNICKNLINLKSLNITKCFMVTNAGALELTNLTHLQQLDISGCSITSEGIAEGICKETNNIIIDLNVSLLHLDEGIIELISEKLPNLRHLDMSHCFTSVTDQSIQSVFKNLLQLNSLSMKSNESVSDAGLTGTGLNRERVIDTPLPIRITSHHISLRSRAEEEIVQDAKRKQKVREMCENNQGGSVQGYALSRLKSLQFLDISKCNRITDVSLIYAFNNKELRTLYLSDCQQISCEGLARLSKNCPSLETLGLSNCNNIRDEGVIQVVKNLPRLKHLYLRNCFNLTDKCVYAIISECKAIKILDIKHCRNISPEVSNSLYCISTLHTLYMTKPGPYIQEVKPTVKAPPPPPQPKFKLLRRIF